MPRSRAQRLRAQLAASRGEVRALEQKVAQLGAASAAAAQEHAATEELLFERLTIADARCQEAVQRAGAAEAKVLQYVEAEQRAGLMDVALGELREVAGRAELAVAEATAWAKLAMAHAAHRKEVKRMRENRLKRSRKKRQKERKREQERCKLGEPAPQEGGSISSAPEDYATAHSDMSSIDSDERRSNSDERRSDSDDQSSSTPSSACEVLFVDHICFWVAAFVPWSWAPVCSKAARFVCRALNIYNQVWDFVGVRVAALQSRGRDHPPDCRLLGPGPGHIYYGYLKVQELREHVLRAREDPASGNQAFITRWVLHMDFQLNMYDCMRLRNRELFLAARLKFRVELSAVDKIDQALKAFDDRMLAEANEEEDGGAAAESSSTA